jgi:branched-chain amino acid transport system permease protein
MGHLLALQFHSNVLGPSIVLGVAAAGLYGLLAIALVLTFRVSRTVGFVMGGLALFSCYFYWWLTFDTGKDIFNPVHPVRMGRLAGLIVVILFGAVIGMIYGATVTGKRMANWPRLNLTIYSLAWLVLLAGLNNSVFKAQDQRLPSVFGTKTFKVLGGVITMHQLATLLILTGLVLGLSFVLFRTQTGIYIRAIADDVEASKMVGISLNAVGTGVYAFTGAISALAGALLASTVGTAIFTVILIFMRALTMSVLGGMTSFSLAMVGCLILGVGESSMNAGVFGPVSIGTREIVIMSALFAAILIINRIRPVKIVEAAGL